MPKPVLFSYIDPVSGTILVQVIVAGIVGCVAFFRRSIWRILQVILPMRQTEDDSAGQEKST